MKSIRLCSHFEICSAALIVLLLIGVGDVFARNKEKHETGKAVIRLITPRGGEVWKEGGTYIITWKSSGVERLLISAAVGGKDKGFLPSPEEGIPAGPGVFKWRIPRGFVTGTGVESSSRVRVMLCPAEGNAECVVSGNFTVTEEYRGGESEEFLGEDSPGETIRTYYRAIERKEYREAYAMLSPCTIVLTNADGSAIAFQPRQDFNSWVTIQRNISRIEVLEIEPLLSGTRKERHPARKGDAKAVVGILTFRVGLQLELKQAMPHLHEGRQDLFITLARGVDKRYRILAVSSGP